MRRWEERERGFVLIVVMALAALASAVAMEIAYQVRIEGERIDLSRDSVQAELFARAGTSLALDRLARDQRLVDDRSEPWAAPIEKQWPEGRVTVTITDEAARYPLNLLFKDDRLDVERKDELNRLMDLWDQPHSLVDSLIDYCDPDQDPFPEGGERDYYEALDPPRQAPNRPLYAIEELALVKDFTPEVAARFGEIGTLYGPKQVNLNTVDPYVLSAVMPAIPLHMAQAVAERAARLPFHKVEDIRDVMELTPEELARLKEKALVTSDAFRITARGRSGATEVILTTIVQRLDNGFVVRYRKIE